MLISYHWLQNYLDINKEGQAIRLPAEELAEILTNTGLEVEDFRLIGVGNDQLSGLVVGYVLEAQKHPNADKLKVTQVDIGTGEPKEIVCGAPNVAAGQKVVVAPVNTILHPISGKPFKIKKAKIRGVESRGMICAEDEIGIGTDHDGIIVLPENAPVGAPVSEVLDIERDWIFDIAITPNRADAMSYLGVARDLVAYLRSHTKYKVNIIEPELSNLEPDTELLPIMVKVEDAFLCPRYSGILFSDLQLGDSPEWMSKYLSHIGVKPINNVVDITNFILHELGQPLHAFDYDKISGHQISVKTLDEATPFVTLDEEERKLSRKDLIICDEKGGMCMAGVYGGLGSGVSEKTKRIFLESAYFNPVAIRQTALRHKLRTDAAMHFEKGTDPNLTVKALERAAFLLKKYAGAKIASKLIDIYPRKINPKELHLDFAYLDKMTGQRFDRNTAREILEALGMQVTEMDETHLCVKVPTVKNEVTRPADLVEELLRIYGYNHIEMPKGLDVSLSLDRDESPFKEKKRLGDYLADQGFMESITLSIENGEKQSGDDVVKLINPLSADLNVMRSGMLPSMLKTAAFNHKRRILDLKIFEFGRSYHKKAGSYFEKHHLTLLMSGMRHPESWEELPREVGFFDLKAIVHGLLAKAGINRWKVKATEEENLDFGLRYEVNGKRLVDFGAVISDLEKAYGLEKPAWYADFDWELMASLAAAHVPKFKNIPRFPSIRRDLALLIDKTTSYRELEKIALESGGHLLESVKLFDIYEDKKMGPDKISYALGFVFRDPEKTLNDHQVDQIMSKLVQRLEKEVRAQIRK